MNFKIFFKIKSYLSIAVALSLSANSTSLFAQVFFSINSSNATTGTMSLNQTTLSDFSPGVIQTGGNSYNYATVFFVPSTSGSYSFGQISAPVDTVMILYTGIFNPNSPSNGLAAGNDDTSQAVHRNTLNNQSVNTMCGNANYCPQVTHVVTAQTRYTVLISTYRPGTSLGNPLNLEFYSTGLGSFYADSASLMASNYRSNTISNLRYHAANAAGVLDSLSANPGAMASVITALDGLSGVAQANAVTQTLPVITGASSQATTNSMQALNQVVQGRQNALRGMASGEEYIGNRDMWMKAFGSWANQADLNGVAGYKINTGGLAIGIDKGISPKINLGGVFAFANSGVSSNSGTAPSGVTINSYQVGVYGDYAMQKNLIANAQLDVGMNQNNAYRNILFMGTNANANYNSYSGHVGAGLRYMMPLDSKNTFIPSIRADYTTVQTNGYTETGAGALNLNVNSQTYNTLPVSADLRVDHALPNKLTLSANAGAGYNILNNQVSITSAYQGGGAAYATNGLQVSPWIYNAGAGLTGQLTKGLEVNVRYDNVFSTTGYMNQMVSAKLKMPI